jgi:hypothetical protein
MSEAKKAPAFPVPFPSRPDRPRILQIQYQHALVIHLTSVKDARPVQIYPKLADHLVSPDPDN